VLVDSCVDCHQPSTEVSRNSETDGLKPPEETSPIKREAGNLQDHGNPPTLSRKLKGDIQDLGQVQALRAAHGAQVTDTVKNCPPGEKLTTRNSTLDGRNHILSHGALDGLKLITRDTQNPGVQDGRRLTLPDGRRLITVRDGRRPTLEVGHHHLLHHPHQDGRESEVEREFLSPPELLGLPSISEEDGELSLSDTLDLVRAIATSEELLELEELST